MDYVHRHKKYKSWRRINFKIYYVHPTEPPKDKYNLMNMAYLGGP